MVNVLIPTKADDTHALYVCLALEKKGHSATLWYTADYPQLQRHTFTPISDKIKWSAYGLDFNIENKEFDVVWLRRPQKPILPDYLHSDDIRNAQRENEQFYKTFWQVVAPNARWVNPVNSIDGANCKLRQLKEAAAVGLKTPESLFSNDPDEIKKFISNYPCSEVIYKPIYPVYWVDQNKLRLTYTNAIKEEMLPSDLVLQATPGIYQRKISKSYELRLTFMGDQVKSVKLNSQLNPKAKLDWRTVPCFEIGIEEYELPDQVYKQCIELMRKLGLAFGCFDFIVTPDNEYYFLEVNEQGQFLWIEESNPSIKMLDAFANFLIRCGGYYLNNDAVSMSEFNEKVHQMQQNAIAKHKDISIFN